MRSITAAGAAANRPPHNGLAEEGLAKEGLAAVGRACFFAPPRFFCVDFPVVVRVAMARRFPSPFIAVAAIAAIAFAGALTAVLTHRTGGSGGALPLAGTVAHFSLSNPRLPAPPVLIQDADGKEISLAEFRGRVVLVNFWATWCAPCLKEMPALDRLEGRLGGDDFEVIAVSIDRTGKAAAEPWLRQNGIQHLKVYLDPQSRAPFAFRGVLGTSSIELPVSVLIDRQGRVVGSLKGAAEWDSSEAEALIRAVMREPA
jgi:thiol-disulfide isomerase/thioredoxin